MTPERYVSVWSGPDGSKLTIETGIEPDLEYLKGLFERILKAINDPDGFLYVDKEPHNDKEETI